jgi:hypothetical protein
MEVGKLKIADIITEWVIFMLILFSSHCYQKVAQQKEQQTLSV